MGETMWAVVVEDDQPLKLGDVEKPSCGPTDVLVEVMTAGLNRADLVLPSVRLSIRVLCSKSRTG